MATNVLDRITQALIGPSSHFFPDAAAEKKAREKRQAEEGKAEKGKSFNPPMDILSALVSLVSPQLYDKLSEPLPGGNPEAPSAMGAISNLQFVAPVGHAASKAMGVEVPEVAAPRASRPRPSKKLTATARQKAYRKGGIEEVQKQEAELNPPEPAKPPKPVETREPYLTPKAKNMTLETALARVQKAGDEAMGKNPELLDGLVKLESLIRQRLSGKEVTPERQAKLDELSKASEELEVTRGLEAARKAEMAEAQAAAPVERLGEGRRDASLTFDGRGKTGSPVEAKGNTGNLDKGGVPGKTYVDENGKFRVYSSTPGEPHKPVQSFLAGGTFKRNMLGEEKGYSIGDVKAQPTQPPDLLLGLLKTYGESLEQVPKGRNAGDIPPLAGGSFKFDTSEAPLRGSVDRPARTVTGEKVPRGQSLLRELREHEARLLDDLARSNDLNEMNRINGELKVVDQERAAEFARLREQGIEPLAEFTVEAPFAPPEDAVVKPRASVTGRMSPEGTFIPEQPQKAEEPPLLSAERGTAGSFYRGVKPESRSNYEDTFYQPDSVNLRPEFSGRLFASEREAQPGDTSIGLRSTRPSQFVQPETRANLTDIRTLLEGLMHYAGLSRPAATIQYRESQKK